MPAGDVLPVVGLGELEGGGAHFGGAGGVGDEGFKGGGEGVGGFGGEEVAGEVGLDEVGEAGEVGGEDGAGGGEGFEDDQAEGFVVAGRDDGAEGVLEQPGFFGRSFSTHKVDVWDARGLHLRA